MQFAGTTEWRETLQPLLERSRCSVEETTLAATVGSFLDRDGHYFLRRPQGEKTIFQTDAPSPTLTHANIMERRTPLDDYRAHPEDAGTLDTAEDLQWHDFVKLTMAQDDLRIPPTVRTSAAAWTLEEFTLPPMLRNMFSTLCAYGVITTNQDTRSSLAHDLPFRLHDTFAETADSAADAALQEPRFIVTHPRCHAAYGTSSPNAAGVC